MHNVIDNKLHFNLKKYLHNIFPKLWIGQEKYIKETYQFYQNIWGSTKEKLTTVNTLVIKKKKSKRTMNWDFRNGTKFQAKK